MWSNLIQHLSGRCKNRTGPFSFLASSLSRWCVVHKLSGVNTVILPGRRPSAVLPFLSAELFAKCSKTSLKIPDNLLQHVGSHPEGRGELEDVKFTLAVWTVLMETRWCQPWWAWSEHENKQRARNSHTCAWKHENIFPLRQQSAHSHAIKHTDSQHI